MSKKIKVEKGYLYHLMNASKPFKKCIDKIPFNLREQFLANVINEDDHDTEKFIRYDKDHDHNRMEAFIASAFVWSETPEGHEFWSKIHDSYLK